jgi:hypothetical protein
MFIGWSSNRFPDIVGSDLLYTPPVVNNMAEVPVPQQTKRTFVILSVFKNFIFSSFLFTCFCVILPDFHFIYKFVHKFSYFFSKLMSSRNRILWSFPVPRGKYVDLLPALPWHHQDCFMLHIHLRVRLKIECPGWGWTSSHNNIKNTKYGRGSHCKVW